MAETTSKGNGLTNVLLGGALLALGYVIYQTYPEQITANATALKSNLMNLFNKGKDNKSNTTDDSSNSNSSNMPNSGESKYNDYDHRLLSSENNDIDLTKQPTLTDELVIDMSKPNEIDVYHTQQFSSDMPYLLPTSVLTHYDASDEALYSVNGKSPTQMVYSC